MTPTEMKSLLKSLDGVEKRAIDGKIRMSIPVRNHDDDIALDIVLRQLSPLLLQLWDNAICDRYGWPHEGGITTRETLKKLDELKPWLTES